MQPIAFPLHRSTRLLTIAAAGFAFATARAQIQPDARELAQTVAAKLGAAQTIQLSAQHRLPPALTWAGRPQRGPIEITVKRPNRFYASQPAGKQSREIAYDGRWFCLMQPRLGLHALERVEAPSIERFADLIDERFGFRPPIAELLSNDLVTQLFQHADSARIAGKERVGWTTCQRLRIEQEGLIGDLWIGVKDKLPHRYRLTFTDLPGTPEWDIRLSRWQLDRPVDESLFAKRPAADSQAVKMIRSK